jgi:hypothetical protein
LIGFRRAPSHHPDRAAQQNQNIRKRIVSLNTPEPEDSYAARHYDASWRSVKAGALLAALVVAIALLI